MGALWISPEWRAHPSPGGEARHYLYDSVLRPGLDRGLVVGSGIWQLYLFFSFLGITLSSGPAPVPYGVVISHWFNRHRGLALGLSMVPALAWVRLWFPSWPNT